MSLENAVASHYTTGRLLARIDSALRAHGLDPTELKPSDLTPLEHMHTGGIEATRRVIKALKLSPGDHVVDLGSGIGGPARAIAAETGARVSGIELTEELIKAARALSDATGFGSQTKFFQANALRIPLPDSSADAVCGIHLGMNIKDKAGLVNEAFRILRPGGRFVLCEIMQGSVAEPLRYPLPWAATPETSFISSPEAYRDLASAAGFFAVSEDEYYTRSLDNIVSRSNPKLGALSPLLMMGDGAAEKVRNHRENMDSGRVIPVQMNFLKPARPQ